MTYLTDEQSVQLSQPIELHEFYTTLNAWYYADGLQDKSFQGDTYTAATIRGAPIEQGQNATKNRSAVHCDYTLPFAWQYIEAPPDGTVFYNRYRLQGSNYVTVFRGTVLGVTFERGSLDDPTEAKIDVDPFTGDMETSAVVLRYSRLCPVPLYSDLCGVDPDDSGLDLKRSGTLTSVSGFTLVASELAEKADGFWVGGDIYVNERRRKIVAHTGQAITVASVVPGAAAGQSYVARAGCDRTAATCAAKFNNLLNFKGHPNIPKENPYSDKGFTV